MTKKKRVYEKPVNIDGDFEEVLKSLSKVPKAAVDKNVKRAKKNKDAEQK